MKLQTSIELSLFENISPTEILLSLQDTAYNLIKPGVKTFEFRKRWRNESFIAYIYRSNKKEISAYMMLDIPIYGTPK